MHSETFRIGLRNQPGKSNIPKTTQNYAGFRQIVQPPDTATAAAQHSEIPPQREEQNLQSLP